jgi:small subunit ribosomal protein S1
MEREERNFGQAPPPPDEGWWAQVLEEADHPAKAAQRPGGSESNEDWEWAALLFENDDTIELPIVGYNRGGLLVEARGLRGFIPISHLCSYDPVQSDDERHEIMASKMGANLILKVIECEPERGRLVFSERAALAGPGERNRLLENLTPGEIVKGVVTNITRFGVFIDLGGLEGLVHVSELSWGRVGHPQDVVQCGEQLEVKVLSVEPKACRVALSLKELLPDPWEEVEQNYRVGDLVEGTVTNVVRFGAFVGLEEGLEGLIHVSELGEGNLLHPRTVLKGGDQLKLRIININSSERRLGLSMRDVPQITDPTGTRSSSSAF